MKEKFVLYGHPLLPCSRSIEVRIKSIGRLNSVEICEMIPRDQ